MFCSSWSVAHHHFINREANSLILKPFFAKVLKFTYISNSIITVINKPSEKYMFRCGYMYAFETYKDPRESSKQMLQTVFVCFKVYITGIYLVYIWSTLGCSCHGKKKNCT